MTAGGANPVDAFDDTEAEVIPEVVATPAKPGRRGSRAKEKQLMKDWKKYWRFQTLSFICMVSPLLSQEEKWDMLL
jgi:hypothetical protein